MKLSVRCENCNYWLPVDRQGDNGECHLSPPIGLIQSAENFDTSKDMSFGYWLVTRIDSFCGKFEKEDG